MITVLKSKQSAIVIWGIIVVLASFTLTGSLSGSVIGYIGGVLYEPVMKGIVVLFDKIANR